MSRKIPASEYIGYDKYIGDEYIVKKNPNMIEIPSNATNGDVIKALFPNGGVAVTNLSKKVGFITRDGNPDDNYVWYPTSWWNAPYKRGDN